jgi:hypothetical protein
MKTLNKTYASAAMLLIIMFTIYACDSDAFLDAPAQGTLSSDVLANADGVEGNLIATYAVLDGYAGYGAWGGGASNWIFGSVVSDNSYKGSEAGDQQPTQDLELFNWTTGGADNYLNDKWTINYDGVSRANATLELLNSVEEIGDDQGGRIRGEATFLRAHYHFELWKMFKNIPYYTEEDEDFKKSNVDTNPIQNILADLDQAISLLPPTQDQVGRVNQWTARAYKGRVQIYTGDYAGGLTTLTEVEQGGPYALEENFHSVFAASKDNGPETILAYQASSGDGDPGGANGNYNDRLNFPHSGSPFGCCGFHQPSQNLVNAFKVDGDGLPLRLSSPGTWNDDDENLAAGASDPVDPRLDWTVGRDGVPFLDWGDHAAGWIRARTFSGPYSAKKTIWEKQTDADSPVGWSSFQLHYQNLHLFRYADMLLLLAEAEVEAGSLENARAIVNRIRTRAGQAVQGPTETIEVPMGDPSVTWADYEIGTYDTPWTDQATARQAVRMERRLELAQEGHRLFDLQRWGIAQDVITEYLSVEQNRREYLQAATQYSEINSMFPIPTRQIDLSTVDGEQRLQQNPGY